MLWQRELYNSIHFYIAEYLKSYLAKVVRGYKVSFGEVPMMIFTLACGYLFTVYILLALAKRARRLTVLSGVVNGMEEDSHTDGSLSPK
ncbi:MAG: hypothetical protein AAF378_06795 [Cyanobacteria bacterium P01_A01_bin.84]